MGRLGLRRLTQTEKERASLQYLELEEITVMSDDQQQNEDEDFNEDGPGIQTGLASWLYVVGGIPMMILFFVVLFTTVGSCDAQNIMLYG